MEVNVLSAAALISYNWLLRQTGFMFERSLKILILSYHTPLCI